jgi:putative phosphoesterase
VKIGVISDTHGYFDPRIPEIFAGVDHILHGGDIGPPAILQQLEQIAPVTAVLGNTDSPWPGIRETETVALGPIYFLLHHIVDPRRPNETVQRFLARATPPQSRSGPQPYPTPAPFSAVIFGHTHKPFCQWIDDVLFFNPGYAGHQRFSLPRSVARLRIDGSRVIDELIWLDNPASAQAKANG